jgi:hypothetical protein
LKGSNLKDAEGNQIIPLCISFSIDATTLTHNSKIVEPIVMFILNMDSPHAIFLGMTPNCPYTSKELHELLSSKYSYFSTRERIIRYTKRKMTLDYFEKLIDPFRKLDETGFLCQIGQGSDTKIVHCFPYIAMVVADNLAANQMCSIIGQGKGIGRRCRICDCSELYRITNKFIYRDPNLTEKYI